MTGVKLKRHERMTEADRVRKIARQRVRRLTNPGINGNLRRVLGKKNYLDLYDELLAYQGGCCAICGKEDSSGRRWHMDHCHETGVIRGLLCFSCNTKLGFVEKYLVKIVEYLTKEKTW